MNEIIYFTKEQLDRFLDAQTPKDKEKLLLQYPDKTHIDIVEIVKNHEYLITDEVFDIYYNSIEGEKEENKYLSKIKKDLQISDKIVSGIHKINRMSDKELEDYISDVEVVSEGYNVLKKRGGMF